MGATTWMGSFPVNDGSPAVFYGTLRSSPEKDRPGQGSASGKQDLPDRHEPRTGPADAAAERIGAKERGCRVGRVAQGFGLLNERCRVLARVRRLY